jgi:VWFA-related protein
MHRGRVRIPVVPWAAPALLVLCVFHSSAFCQRAGTNPYAGTMPAPIPITNVGAGPMEARFESMDFSQMFLEHQNRSSNQKEHERQKALVESGTVSALDLAAPAKAVSEFNQGTSLSKGRHSQEAIGHFRKAIAVYPKFVSAHNCLGMTYLDLDDATRAQEEFEVAASLDDKFPGAFLNLGRLALSQDNFVAAGSHLEKAAALLPRNPEILTALAYAQNGNHQYREAIKTVGRVHALQHNGMGTAHYVAAVAAIALNDLPVAQSELALFLSEDPANPLVPSARHNLDVLGRSLQIAGSVPGAASQQPTMTLATRQPPSFANSDRLKVQLAGIEDMAGGDDCHDCAETSAAGETNPTPASSLDLDRAIGSSGQWTIHKAVDEVAVFFGVSSGGRAISDLVLNDIKVRDDDKPPEKILQFSSQSKLPLRLGLLIDTSGSVQERFSFEKHTAVKFLQQMLTNSSDLGFVAGFADKPTVTQDFTENREQLASGVNKLTNQGGTALFDAVSFACWKLAAYPERDKVATVLVVVSDGEDNSSRTSLRQAIRDEEATGVTIYTISTKEGGGLKTEADKVLQALAAGSGGEAFFPGDMSSLGRSFDKLRDQIRSRYLIAYKPADFEPNGKYRTITITAEKSGKRLQVHARKGYHARLTAITP